MSLQAFEQFCASPEIKRELVRLKEEGFFTQWKEALRERPLQSVEAGQAEGEILQALLEYRVQKHLVEWLENLTGNLEGEV